MANTASVLSSEVDGEGYYYGFATGDYRQINVRSYDMDRWHGLWSAKRWIALVGDHEVGHGYRTKDAAEQAALYWIADNPPEDITDDGTDDGEIIGTFYPGAGPSTLASEQPTQPVLPDTGEQVRVTRIDPVTLQPLGPHDPDLVPGRVDADAEDTATGAKLDGKA